MLLMKWIFLFFMLLKIEKKFSFAKTDILPAIPIAILNTDLQNFTFSNSKTDPDSMENNENDYEISDLVRAAQYSSSFKKNNNAPKIRIHCYMKNNSVIECTYNDYKSIIRLNNNKLNQNQIRELIGSVHLFIDSLTNNYNLTQEQSSLMIPSSYPIQNNREELNMLTKLTAEEMVTFRTNLRGPSITDEDRILQSNDYNQSNKFKNLKNCNVNQQNNLIECSLNNNDKFYMDSFADNGGLQNVHREPVLKLICRLTTNEIFQPKTFSIPVFGLNAEPYLGSMQKNEKKFYDWSFDKYTNVTETNGNLNSHRLKKRFYRVKLKANKQKMKIINKNELNNDKNSETENYETNTDKKDYSVKNNFDQDSETLSNDPDALKTKLECVKTWMFNLKERTPDEKKEVNDDVELKQSPFLFHAKRNNFSKKDEFSLTKATNSNVKKYKNLENSNKQKQTTRKITKKIDRVKKPQDTYDDYEEDDETTIKSTTKRSKNQDKYTKYNKTTKINDNNDDEEDITKATTRKKKKGKSHKHRQNATHYEQVTESIDLEDSFIATSEETAEATEEDDNDNGNSDDDTADDTVTKTHTTVHTTRCHRKFKTSRKKTKNRIASLNRNKSDETGSDKKKQIIMNEKQATSISPQSTSAGILKKIFNIHHHSSKNESDKIKNEETSTSTNEKKVNLTDKRLLKDKMEIRLSNENLKLNTEDGDEDDDDDIEEDEEDEKNCDKQYNKNKKGKITSSKINNYQSSRFLNYNHNYENMCIEKFRQEENRRKKLFDYISYLKKLAT